MKIEVYSPTIRRKEMDAVLTALVEDKIGPGEQGRFLIQNAKELLRFDYCLALRSPAIALYCALKALDLKDGQGVILSALSPRYYLWVLRELRLSPIFCDVAGGIPLINRATVEAAIGRQEGLDVRCILLYHSLGFLPDSSSIAELGIPIIDDRSQSFGSYIEENPAPNQSSAGADTGETVNRGFACFTILGLEERDMLTSGGGALLYAMNRREGSVLRNFAGIPSEYTLPDMNAAMAVIQFRESLKNLEKRREIAKVYDQAVQRTRHRRFARSENLSYNNYAFSLILETGLKDVKAYARKKDILVETAFANTLMGTFTKDTEEWTGWESELTRGLGAETCPEAYSLSLRTVLFPLYPRLSSAEVERIAKLILTLP
jgi:dTDP-4-amino-4,6-dideoxygalactose transaminase